MKRHSNTTWAVSVGLLALVGYGVYSSLPPTTYEGADRAGLPLDCDEMIEASVNPDESNRYQFERPWFELFPQRPVIVYVRESNNDYQFTQCRDQIEAQRRETCMKHLRDRHQYGSGHTFRKLSATSSCSDELTEFKRLADEQYLRLNDEYELQGNAFIAQGFAFSRASISITPIELAYGYSVTYYTFKLSSGGHDVMLRYGSKERAEQAHAELVAFIAS